MEMREAKEILGFEKQNISPRDEKLLDAIDFFLNLAERIDEDSICDILTFAQAKLALKELVIEKLKEILKKREEERYGKLVIKPNIQPGHGSCCTCQVCGYNYDDCNCQIREAIKWIDQAISQIAEMFK